MRAYGSATAGGPMSGRGVPLPLARPTGTDAISHHNQRPDRTVTPSLNGTPADVRAWAIANGFEVNLRGAIPSRVRNAYEQEARRA